VAHPSGGEVFASTATTQQHEQTSGLKAWATGICSRFLPCGHRGTVSSQNSASRTSTTSTTCHWSRMVPN